ncbi:MAG: hypothetical protein BAJALOKI3v1_210014 [Promethearchaeota archaeon]|nr:MAG: hypothetical protein BAJALOKI3v1_210014 [Candidatus Lokiarchaeota archaeon]
MVSWADSGKVAKKKLRQNFFENNQNSKIPIAIVLDHIMDMI